MQNETLQRYLRKFHKFQYSLNTRSEFLCDIAIIIPIKNEFPGIKTTISSLMACTPLKNYSVGVFGVVNNSTDDSKEVKQNNAETLVYFNSLNKVGQNQNLRFFTIDASSMGNELPNKIAGVGVARKVGMDAALLMLRNPLTGVMVCLDSDCTVNRDYLTAIADSFKEGNVAAAIALFRHKTEGLSEQHLTAILSYEIYIRFYALGLKFAGSSYSYLPVGSTMMSTGAVYMKAEGMNQRKAAEDFYFLEKISKFSEIKSIPEAIVFPSARVSRRVPFGTGPAIDDMLKEVRNPDLIYDPSLFKYLHLWIILFQNDKLMTAEKYFELAAQIHPGIYDYLTGDVVQREFRNFLAHSKQGVQLILRKKNWFDALRTLRMIHTLRDRYIPDIPIDAAITELAALMQEELPVMSGKKIIRLQEQLDWLRKFEINS